MPGQPESPVVFLMGPTASGKTALAVELVRRLPVDIVSVDSAMVYRGLDIGTAKPPPAVLAEAPHRLIDILDPAQAYSAGQFRRDALREIDDIRRRGRVPLLVGGTMLYFRALAAGIARLPHADPAVRAALDARAAAEGWPALHAELARVDAAAAARIHPNDAQRIQRALEVWQVSGEPMSSLQRRDAGAPLGRVLRFALAPPQRQTLHGAIGERLDRMLAAGFVDEVRALFARGDLGPELPAIRAVGYRQLWRHVAGDWSLDQAREAAMVATRRLAKRQTTWLRGEPALCWLDATDPGAVETLVGLVDRDL